ncbi:hypothetical protein ACFZAM_31995 [Streptomyces sp. NPDC008079]|uniref:hypothetical protein n=1 Tax=Streptomyces sp. NPDC008079 TaxID=3364806 RepID=UPI0036E10820
MSARDEVLRDTRRAIIAASLSGPADAASAANEVWTSGYRAGLSVAADITIPPGPAAGRDDTSTGEAGLCRADIETALGTYPCRLPLGHGGDCDELTDDSTPAPVFFQPGRTYQRGRWSFHCRNVSPAPTPDAPICAIGFLTRTDGTCTVHALGQEHWADAGWTDVTRPPTTVPEEV